MSEHDHQKALFDWAKVAVKAHPVLELMYAIPNGGQRHPAVAARLRAEGVKAGIPDVHLPVMKHDMSKIGLWIEMKFGNNTLSKGQEGKILLLEKQGHECHVSYSWTEARDIILRYIGALPLVQR